MTLHLYVLRQLLVSIGFSLAGILLLVIPTVAIQAVYELGAFGLQAVLRYLPLSLVEIVPYVLPMAFLLGVVATFGRLEADRELTAIRMAGFHPARLLLPGLLVALPMALATDWILAEVSPAWKFARRDFMRSAEEDAFRNLTPTRGELDFGDFYMRWERKEGTLFHNVLLSFPGAEEGEEQPREEGGEAPPEPIADEQTVVAERVELSFEDDVLVVRLADAQVLSGAAEFESAAPVVRLPLDQLVKHDPKKRDHPKYMRTRELRDALRSGRLEDEKAYEFRYQVHARHALSLTYLVFLLLGVPTGTLLRAGTQLAAFTGAVVYAFLYYVLAMRLGKELASEAAVPVAAAAWATDGLFLVAGAALSYKALWR